MVDDGELQIVDWNFGQQHVLLNRKGSLTLYELEVGSSRGQKICFAIAKRRN